MVLPYDKWWGMDLHKFKKFKKKKKKKKKIPPPKKQAINYPCGKYITKIFIYIAYDCLGICP